MNTQTETREIVSLYYSFNEASLTLLAVDSNVMSAHGWTDLKIEQAPALSAPFSFAITATRVA